MFRPEICRPLLILTLALGFTACAQPDRSPHITASQEHAWVSDLGNGYYQNPVIHADYSDPDVIRVGDTYYMTASSFNSAPGLPLLTSKDMVNWQLVGHAFQQQTPLDLHARPQHGGGVWAPSLRHHDGKFWIFYGDPDEGIYVHSAETFTGPWERHLLLPGKGLIDPTPLWDDDGNAYLLHAWASSRAGINNVLSLRRMSPDARKILDDEAPFVIDGNQLPGYRTLEGPKFYKHDGYYYVFAPAGGVEPGWQSVFRSRDIYGPYEDRIVLDQGNTPINGPHQGAWVRTPEGTDWFYHFQSKGIHGRIVHMQPMTWKDGWPLMGQNVNEDGVGEPVLRHRKPIDGFPITVPATSDDFENPTLGLQWQWNANWKPEWFSLTERPGHLRLFSRYDEQVQEENSLWNNPALLLQKLPAPEFTATTHLTLNGSATGDRAGLLYFGYNYAWIGLRREGDHNELVYAVCHDTRVNCDERIRIREQVPGNEVFLRTDLLPDGTMTFSYSLDGKRYQEVGGTFNPDRGRWVGGKIGLFSVTDRAESAERYADFDYIKVTPRK